MVVASNKPAIIVTGADLAPQAVSILKDFELVFAGKTPDEDSLVRLCKQTQPVAIIVRYGKIPGRVMDASDKLRVISKHGVGIDTIDVQAAKDRGIAVKAATGANAAAVAEHTWALIMACAKRVVPLDRRMREGHWDKATHKSVELAGRTLGLVGLGAIGGRVAQVGAALDMKIVAFDPYAKQVPTSVSLVSLAEVRSRADVLSLHCPLTPETRAMINRQTLAEMRDGVIIVNTARGGLIDEPALIDALTSGKVSAAGLDTFSVEPLTAPHALQNVDNVILSPHIGGVTSDAYVNMGVAAANNILTVLTSVDPQRRRERSPS